MYVYFRYGKDGASGSTSKGSGYQHSGYINQSSLRRDPYSGPPETVIASNGRRRPSLSKSEASDIPLEPTGIHTKTTFVVREEYTGDGRS